MAKVIIEFNGDHNPQYLWVAKRAQDFLKMVVQDVVDDYKLKQLNNLDFFVGPYEEQTDFTTYWYLKASEVVNTSYYDLYNKVYKFAIHNPNKGK